MNSAPNYEEFWQASSYSPFNLAEMGNLQETFSGQRQQPSLLEYSAKPLPLPRLKRHALAGIENNRKSVRQFTDNPLSMQDLSNLLSSFRALDSLEHRTYPSAGGRYGLEIFCAALHVEGLERELFYYNADLHAMSTIGKTLPSWKELSPYVNLTTNQPPQCLLIFVSFPDRLTAKYAERGGRFALIECGAAMQQLTLHIAATKHLGGCPIGGLVDRYWTDLLDLDQTAQIMLGYGCGTIPRPKRWKFPK